MKIIFLHQGDMFDHFIVLFWFIDNMQSAFPRHALL